MLQLAYTDEIQFLIFDIILLIVKYKNNYQKSLTSLRQWAGAERMVWFKILFDFLKDAIRKKNWYIV